MTARLRNLWAYRELLLTLVKKELKVRYKGSFLGILWSMVNPLLTLIVFSIVFGTILLPDPTLQPFAVFLLAGLIPWNLFMSSLAGSVGSIVGSAGLIKKVSFPREILPLSVIGASVFHSLLEILVLLVFLVVTGFKIGPVFILFPFLLMIELVLIVALALFLSALNVYYRDVQHFLGIALTLWFWLTPIVYPIALLINRKIPVTHPLAFDAYLLNPMTPIVMATQSVVFHHQLPGFERLAASLFVALVLLVAGYWYFSRVEGNFAEEV